MNKVKIETTIGDLIFAISEAIKETTTNMKDVDILTEIVLLDLLYTRAQ